jgi:thiamine monophosphate kinase
MRKSVAIELSEIASMTAEEHRLALSLYHRQEAAEQLLATALARGVAQVALLYQEVTLDAIAGELAAAS